MPLSYKVTIQVGGAFYGSIIGPRTECERIKYHPWLSHIKEWNKAICSDMDGPRDCHTEWSKTEKDKHHMISLICGLKNWYKWTYFQNRRVTDVENKLMVTKGKGGGRGKLGDWDWHIHTTIKRDN